MKTVLLVQDNLVRQHLMRTYLNKVLGKNILILANDGIEGINLFKINQDTIDFVIMDFNMPNMNGDESIKGILNIAPNTLILGWTNIKNTIDIKKMEVAGVVGFLQYTGTSKDFKISLLNYGLIDENDNIILEKLESTERLSPILAQRIKEIIPALKSLTIERSGDMADNLTGTLQDSSKNKTASAFSKQMDKANVSTLER